MKGTNQTTLTMKSMVQYQTPKIDEYIERTAKRIKIQKSSS
jgi:hypothetical protein